MRNMQNRDVKYYVQVMWNKMKIGNEFINQLCLDTRNL